MQPQYTIEYSNPLRTHSTHIKSGNIIITDAPTDNHGKGEAFSPTDLLSVSLVTCAMTILGITSQAGPVEILSMSAGVSKEMGDSPRHVGEISALIKVHLKGGDKSEHERLERAARACPVAKSLSSELVQNLEFQFIIE
jgi:putative redox protein